MHVGEGEEERAVRDQGPLAERLLSVGRLAAGVGHEINNPLSYVVANVGFAAAELERLIPGLRAGDRPALQEVAGALADALEGARRVQEIVRGLTCYARIDRHEAGVHEQVLEAAVKLMGGRVEPEGTAASGGTFRVILPPAAQPSR